MGISHLVHQWFSCGKQSDFLGEIPRCVWEVVEKRVEFLMSIIPNRARNTLIDKTTTTKTTKRVRKNMRKRNTATFFQDSLQGRRFQDCQQSFTICRIRNTMCVTTKYKWQASIVFLNLDISFYCVSCITFLISPDFFRWPSRGEN